MKYKMDRSGIRRMMRGHPGIHRKLFEAGNKGLAIAQSRAHVRTGRLRASGRLEDAGIQPVMRGEPRMTVRVVFHAPYAMDQEMKNGFLSGALGRKRTR